MLHIQNYQIKIKDIFILYCLFLTLAIHFIFHSFYKQYIYIYIYIYIYHESPGFNVSKGAIFI